MFVNEGARDLLLKAERESFLERQWPEIRAKLRRLGLKLADLPQEEG
jgi:GntR family transcriptional regulator